MSGGVILLVLLAFNNYFWLLIVVMKNVLILFLLVAVSAGVNAQTASTTPPPAIEVLQVKETSHDFGKIPQGRPVTYIFEIVNTGKEPLVLDNVQASCGCTTPQWSKDPIAPGATAKITVGYNAYTEGFFEKPVTIQYNQNQTKMLTIKGTVYKAPPAPAPENASIRLLKQINQ
jgi:Protein of unknown function (DUF1573)